MADHADSIPAPAPQQGPVTRAIRATEREHDPSRRLLIAGLAAAPFAAAPALAFAPSDLARSCDWAVAHNAWIVASTATEDWPDDRVSAEVDRYDDVFLRAIREGSASLGDIKAKARMLLNDLLEGDLVPERGEPERPVPKDERLIRVVLREIIALAA